MFRCTGVSKMWVAVLALLLLTGPVLAAGPVFWEISKQDDIVKGDARGVSIAENGAITLAPAFTLVYDTKEAYIWSSASDAAGNVYLGTGHEGRVFRVDPSGAGKLLYDAPELDVTALATDGRGNVYAGTSPDGKVYKIAPDGTQSVFYDPPDKYIWSLAFDAAGSTLFAATGDKGIIYAIDSAGKAAVYADTNETNVVSLAIDKTGSLIAGTDPSGLVLRISRDGKTFALFDSPMQEIHRLIVSADGSLFALGINQQAAAQRGGNLGVSSSTSISSDGVITISTSDDQEGSVQTVDLSGNSPSRSRSKADGAKSAVFRISPDGGSEVVWRSSSTVGFGLSLRPDGHVLVGTGDKGRIYSIASADRSYTLLVQSPEDQTSTLIATGDNLFATSSNLGRLYRLGHRSVANGTYSSPVHDTKFAGKWGVLTWRGEGNVELQTRSGNTESPDATWSDWSPSYRNAIGDQISSPRARFIQWRATLRSDSGGGGNQGTNPTAARLQSVVIAYLPRNQAPEVTSATVLAPGVALQEMPLAVDPSIASSGLDPQLFGLSLNVPPRRFFQKGARTVTWQAGDPNDDDLTYKLLYRTIGDNDWHALAENLSQSYYTIDGNKLPDGSYVFKVQASDAPGNPIELALTHDVQTEAVEIDNTPPSIKVNGPTVTGLTADLTFEVTDLTSRVIRGEYSVDGGIWRLVYPVDGIADSARENFTLKVKFDKSGEHVIAFRCADSSANVGTSKVSVTSR